MNTQNALYTTTVNNTGGIQTYQGQIGVPLDYKVKVVPQQLFTPTPTPHMSTDDIKLLDRELTSKGYAAHERKFYIAVVMSNGVSVANLLYNLARAESALDTSSSNK